MAGWWTLTFYHLSLSLSGGCVRNQAWAAHFICWVDMLETSTAEVKAFHNIAVLGEGALAPHRMAPRHLEDGVGYYRSRSTFTPPLGYP
ncbi:hypothetical protein E2C01_091287 [Portunus trituberculatus]|uniref:Secreted protein n=1 Tax=Portunus trituberculatus TaxID=210409 RepID=A0A5B7JDK8_PORTR|nr:hypothetical protein [Portunus trituberculatus]